MSRLLFLIAFLAAYIVSSCVFGARGKEDDIKHEEKKAE